MPEYRSSRYASMLPLHGAWSHGLGSGCVTGGGEIRFHPVRKNSSKSSSEAPAKNAERTGNRPLDLPASYRLRISPRGPPPSARRLADERSRARGAGSGSAAISSSSSLCNALCRDAGSLPFGFRGVQFSPQSPTLSSSPIEICSLLAPMLLSGTGYPPPSSVLLLRPRSPKIGRTKASLRPAQSNGVRRASSGPPRNRPRSPLVSRRISSLLRPACPFCFPALYIIFYLRLINTTEGSSLCRAGFVSGGSSRRFA